MGYYYDLLIQGDILKEEKVYYINGYKFIYKNKMLREYSNYSFSQTQTKDTFSFKWKKMEELKGFMFDQKYRDWLITKYFDGKEENIRKLLKKNINFLDAGCGSGYSVLHLFSKELRRVNYLGIDISDAIDICRKNFKALDLNGEFIQVNIDHIPFKVPIFDVIFSEGVLHHTDSPAKAFHILSSLLRKGGLILFYIYRKKAPIREFVDDYIRRKLKNLKEEEAWNILMPLSKLGRILGELKEKIVIEEDIELLNIPKGNYGIQEFFYWYIMKIFYRPDMTLEELNMINFDWYKPLNAHRYTKEEVEKWCIDFGLEIKRIYEEPSGYTVIARKK